MVRVIELIRSRRGAMAGGLGIVVLSVAVINVFRSVQPSETLAVLLYLIIIVAALFFSFQGALLAAGAASVLYAFMRKAGPTEAAPFAAVSVRALSYILFAALVSFGLAAITGRRHRLDTGSVFDEKTGLASITHLVTIIDHEIARSVRYDRRFSLALVDLPFAAAGSKERVAYESMLDELGDQVREAIRTTDYAGIRTDPRSSQIVVVLPETPSEGAGIFALRFGERIADFLLRRSVAVSRNPASWFEFPADANDVRRVRNELARLVDLPLAIASGGIRR